MSLPVTNLIEFAEAALAADYSRLRKVGQQLVHEIATTDADGARRFRLALNRKGVPLQAAGFTEMLPVDGKSRLPLVEEHPWPTEPVFLDEVGREQFGAFIADVTNFELLVTKGVASNLSLMLSGPPGVGKTLLAGHVAAQLGRKLYVVRLDSVISSMLGDTAKNIRSIFDFVAGKNSVLFLDELDAVAKMRDDRNELGELKRVVNTVIQGIDSLDDSAVVIAATNHAQMLDKAIWRRFPYKIEFGLPDQDLRQALWQHFLGGDDEWQGASFMLALLSDEMTGAEIEQHAFSARRSAIHKAEPLDVVKLALAVIDKRAEHGREKATQSRDSKRRLVNFLTSQHGISQADIARFLGVSRQAVSNYLKASAHAE
ncbi:AAA family ATPase [Robbsia andropogonis]|uniref:AAA family ATPase n=1 Tax=Robbsia andropogonis TaxID=28092 RepID=UPI000465F2C4|nr:AAA family ATPase [Robbsia andropogonis]